MTADKFPLLSQIQSPADLRELSAARLNLVAQELREYLIDTVSRTGGHLAAGLGTVELTVAVHATFNTPEDRLVWDIGHQAYPHKILTGRRDQMKTLRRKGGLNGFLKRNESEFDTFGAGHSSTSISAALGMAVAASRQGSGRKTVAIIGDGALTAGQALEALNNAGPEEDTDLLVILNDNEMSISPNLGAIRNHLSRILSSPGYSTVREGGKNMLDALPLMQKFAGRWEEHMKGMVMPGTLFEEFGFNYIGPIDGHDIPLLLRTLENMKQLKGRQFLHVITKKGKGFPPAEANPCKYHGVAPFDRDTGEMPTGSSGQSFTQTFGDWLCERAEQDNRLMGITPAMREGSGMVEFSDRFPKQYFDVGIAEQHAVTFAAGLACEGMKPVVAIYSTFLQRAYDQLVHDVAIQNLDVTFAIDRAGLVGPDGATHAGSLDLSFLRCVPNMVIMAPSNQAECFQMLSTAFEYVGPAAVRYPKGGVAFSPEVEAGVLEIGRGVIVRRGQRVAILAFGTLLEEAEQAAENLDATLVNMRFVKPLDLDLIREMAEEHECIVTLEDNVIAGGAGSGVGEALAAMGVTTRLLHLGLPDQFVAHATRDEQLAECGLDAAGISAGIKKRLFDNPESSPSVTDSPAI